MSTKSDKGFGLQRVKIKAIDIVAMVAAGTQTVWTPPEGKTLVLLAAVIQCKHQTTAVTTSPVAELVVGSVPITQLLTLPIVEESAKRFAFENRDTFTALAVSFTDTGDLVTFAVPHGLKTGDRVVFATIVTTTGITALTTYYAIPSLTNAAIIQVADTYANAIARSALALTTNGTGTATFSGGSAIQFTNDTPLKFSLAVDQAGATVLKYDLTLFGVEINDLNFPAHLK